MSSLGTQMSSAEEVAISRQVFLNKVGLIAAILFDRHS